MVVVRIDGWSPVQEPETRFYSIDAPTDCVGGRPSSSSPFQPLGHNNRQRRTTVRTVRSFPSQLLLPVFSSHLPLRRRRRRRKRKNILKKETQAVKWRCCVVLRWGKRRGRGRERASNLFISSFTDSWGCSCCCCCTHPLIMHRQTIRLSSFPLLLSSLLTSKKKKKKKETTILACDVFRRSILSSSNPRQQGRAESTVHLGGILLI